ncbi:MAG: NAD(P)/FAD-dependent oxidoreductase [Candidatus Eisenbacteria bacterium]
MFNLIPNTVDVLVAGAGVAGAVAARRVAEAGHSVLLVDRLPADDVGRKICGNGVADDGIESISHYTEPPAGAEVAWRVDGGVLVLQDGVTRLPVPKSGAVLNRLLLGQRLLGDAVDAGALFVERCSCAGWNDRAAGSVRLDVEDGGSRTVTARVVIDASGYRAVLAKTGGPLRQETVGRDEVGIGYREIVPLTAPLPEPRTVIVDLGPKEARGGYAWIFPMGEHLANIGIGAPLHSAGRDLRAAYRSFLDGYPDVHASEPVDAGAGMLPLRRPLATMVGDGFIAVGDAGCQTNPLHGGGIAPGMVGGGMAGDVVAEALANGGASAEALWPYNGRFMREIGARHAGHDFLRKTLFSLTEEEFDFLTLELTGAGVLMEALAEGGARLPLKHAFRVLAKAARRPGLVSLFVRAGHLIENIQELFNDYPDSPARLDSWLGRVEYTTRALDRLMSRR